MGYIFGVIQKVINTAGGGGGVISTGGIVEVAEFKAQPSENPQIINVPGIIGAAGVLVYMDGLLISDLPSEASGNRTVSYNTVTGNITFPPKGEEVIKVFKYYTADPDAGAFSANEITALKQLLTVNNEEV